MANAFSYNGTDLGQYGLTVVGSIRSVLTELQTPMTEVAGRDGAFPADGRWQPRQITIPCEVAGANTAAILSSLDTIKRIIGSRSDQQLILDYQNDRYYMARLYSAVDAQAGPQVWSFDLTFICADPFAYKTGSETEIVLTLSGSPDTENTAVILGSAPAWGVWVYDPGGTASGFTIENTTSGVGTLLNYNFTITNGTDFRITPEEELVERDSGAGYSDHMNNISGSFPWLKPGVANSIRVTGASSGTLTITYRPRYL